MIKKKIINMMEKEYLTYMFNRKGRHSCSHRLTGPPRAGVSLSFRQGHRLFLSQPKYMVYIFTTNSKTSAQTWFTSKCLVKTTPLNDSPKKFLAFPIWVSAFYIGVMASLKSTWKGFPWGRSLIKALVGFRGDWEENWSGS